MKWPILIGCLLGCCIAFIMLTLAQEPKGPWPKIYEFGYNGHSYIQFSYPRQIVIIHDPNCKGDNK